MPGHEQTVASAFTAQAAGYDASPATNAPGVLDAIAELARPHREQTWLDAACGSGIVSRRLAGHVRALRGIDLTPQMIELARRSAAEAGLANVTFEPGDATATGLPDDAVDGAVTRFSLHHVPVPGRLVDELARVVGPGGRIVVADQLADDDGAARAFAQEIERLRDPSHWASLTPSGLAELSDRAGLRLLEQRTLAFAIDFEEWLRRGTSDRAAHRLVERRLAESPGGTGRFAVTGTPGARTLTLQLWVGAWEVPTTG